MIPKVIHYCWFGGKPLPKLVKKCIKSWKKYCPDYEIKEWNESNFDLDVCAYVKQAYEAKKWAFVSDYVRHYVLFNEGGLYLDTDVEILKPIDDLLKNDFMGFEDDKSVNCGLVFGASKNSKYCELMLNSYNNDNFILDNGKLNLFTVCQRTTSLLKEYGLNLDGKTQQVLGLTVYSSEYFNPLGVDGKGKITENSYSIHHYMASWYSKKEKFLKFLGPKFVKKLVKIKRTILRQK